MFSRSSLLPSVRSALSVINRKDNVFGHNLLSQRISPNADVPDVGFDKANHPSTVSIRNFKSVSWRKRSIAIKNRLRQAEQRYKKPGQIIAVSMPLSPQEMDNTMLVVLSQMGKQFFFLITYFLINFR